MTSRAFVAAFVCAAVTGWACGSSDRSGPEVSSSGAPAPSSSTSAADTCAATTPKTLERVTCLEGYVRTLTLETSATEAMCRAKALALDGVVDDCHWLAHVIGKANLEKAKGDVGKAFSTCPLGCSEGCYHGVISTWLAGRDKSTIARDLLAVCKDFANGSVERRQCIHGVGHGLLMNGSMTLASAVAACRSSSEAFFVDTCLGGVFMEHVAESTQGYPAAQLLEHLSSLCPGLSPADTATCSEAIGEGLMFYTGHDLPKSLALCKGVTDAYRASCEAGARDESSLAPETRCAAP